MSKVKINRPVQISLDDFVYGIKEITLENTGLKAYSSIAYTVEGVRTNAKNVEMMDIVLMDKNNNERVEVLSKLRHNPESKPGEIFLNESDTLSALRKLTDKQFEAAKKAFNMLEQLKDKYDTTESIAPDPDAPDVFVNMDKKRTVIEKK